MTEKSEKKTEKKRTNNYLKKCVLLIRMLCSISYNNNKCVYTRICVVVDDMKKIIIENVLL
jgi:hypothetical protein